MTKLAICSGKPENILKQVELGELNEGELKLLDNIITIINSEKIINRCNKFVLTREDGTS